MSILHYLVIDIVEMIVVYTKSYDMYREVSDVVVKLKGDDVHTRIRDKLTFKSISKQYKLRDSDFNREYDKPFVIIFSTMVWGTLGRLMRFMFRPRAVSVFHRIIYINYKYEMIIYHDGYHELSSKRNNVPSLNFGPKGNRRVYGHSIKYNNILD